MVLTRNEILNSRMACIFFDNIEIMYGVGVINIGLDLLTKGHPTSSAFTLLIGGELIADGIYGRLHRRESYLMDFGLTLLEGIENRANNLISLIRKYR